MSPIIIFLGAVSRRGLSPFGLPTGVSIAMPLTSSRRFFTNRTELVHLIKFGVYQMFMSEYRIRMFTVVMGWPPRWPIFEGNGLLSASPSRRQLRSPRCRPSLFHRVVLVARFWRCVARYCQFE
jgi:hypothetical protein